MDIVSRGHFTLLSHIALQYVKNEMILLMASIFLKTDEDQRAAKIFLRDSTIHHFRHAFDIIQYLSN